MRLPANQREQDYHTGVNSPVEATLTLCWECPLTSKLYFHGRRQHISNGYYTPVCDHLPVRRNGRTGRRKHCTCVSPTQIATQVFNVHNVLAPWRKHVSFYGLQDWHEWSCWCRDRNAVPAAKGCHIGSNRFQVTCESVEVVAAACPGWQGVLIYTGWRSLPNGTLCVCRPSWPASNTFL